MSPPKHQTQGGSVCVCVLLKTRSSLRWERIGMPECTFLSEKTWNQFCFSWKDAFIKIIIFWRYGSIWYCRALGNSCFKLCINSWNLSENYVLLYFDQSCFCMWMFGLGLHPICFILSHCLHQFLGFFWSEFHNNGQAFIQSPCPAPPRKENTETLKIKRSSFPDTQIACCGIFIFF